jgi:uncharacterized protein YgbK (DUF1537 family)
MPETAPLIGIVADDLTGANDTALSFLAHGFGATVWPRIPSDPSHMTATTLAQGPQAMAVNTASRYASPLEASKKVIQAVQCLKATVTPGYFYKKLDSTLRGPLGAEVLAMVQTLGVDVALVVPAFPSAGRTTVKGLHTLHGVPIAQTPVAQDPLAPVTTSDLPTLLAQTVDAAWVGHLDLASLRQGPQAIEAQLAQCVGAGQTVIAVDAATDDDLVVLAKVIAHPANSISILPCGTAALAQALAQIWASRLTTPTPMVPLALPDEVATIVVVGSHTALTRQQVQVLQASLSQPGGAVLALDPVSALGLASPEAMAAWVAQGQAALMAHQVVVITASPTDESVAQTLLVAEQHQVSVQDAMARPAQTLATLTRKLAQWAAQARRSVHVVVAGGETAAAVCEALQINQLSLQGEVEPAIPWMRGEGLVDGPLSVSVSFVTKSGHLGSCQALAKAVGALLD